MEIRRLDHAALLVKDIERSRRFYGQVLGMKEVPRPSNFTFPLLTGWLSEARYEVALPAWIYAEAPGFVRDVPRST